MKMNFFGAIFAVVFLVIGFRIAGLPHDTDALSIIGRFLSVLSMGVGSVYWIKAQNSPSDDERR